MQYICCNLFFSKMVFLSVQHFMWSKYIRFWVYNYNPSNEYLIGDFWSSGELWWKANVNQKCQYCVCCVTSKSEHYHKLLWNKLITCKGNKQFTNHQNKSDLKSIYSSILYLIGPALAVSDKGQREHTVICLHNTLS